MNLAMPAALLIAAFSLDLAVGDPPWLPHPVVRMGKAIAFGERRLHSGDPRRDFIMGAALALIVVGLSAAGAGALAAIFARLAPPFAFAAVAAAAATTLATRGLLDAVKRIEAPLRAGDLAGARANLSHIVGRDTAHLDRDKVLAAGLESLAESTCDGIVAPLFYLFIGGLPLALAYKAVSTLDSMIGYPTERYFYFGKFAARMDDLANFLPARLTAGFIVVAAAALGLNPARAWRIAWRDRACHLSPNAGYPEAAFAGAFGVRLGGPGVYFGKEIRKPYIGDNVKSLEIDSLKKGRALCLATALLALATFALLASARS